MNGDFIPCASYGRTSDEDTFNKECNSTKQQGHMNHELAMRISSSKGREYKILYNLLEEEAVSGATVNRPKYQELLGLIEEGSVKAIFAKELSRLSRSTADVCALVSMCEKYRVELFFNNGFNYENDNIQSKMLIQLFGVLAEQERSIIIDRTKTSIRSRVKNEGIPPGGPTVLGFKKVVNSQRWEVEENELEIVRNLMMIFIETMSYMSTCKKANELNYKTKTGKNFSKDYLKRILKNHKYIGKLRIPKDRNDSREYEYVDLGVGTPINVELFSNVQKTIDKIEKDFRYSNKIGKKRVYPLSSLLEYEDGSKFTGEVGGNKFYYYNKMHKKRICASKLEEAVLKSFSIFEKDDDLARMIQENCQKLNVKRKALVKQVGLIELEIKSVDLKVERAVSNLLELESLNSDVVKIMEKKIVEFNSELDCLKVKKIQLVEKLKRYDSQRIEFKPLKEIMGQVFTRLKNASYEVQRGLYRNLIKRVRLHKENKLEVIWIPEICGPGGQVSSLGSKWGGGQALKQNSCPPAYLSNIIEFQHGQLSLSRDFLYTKYIVEKMSCENISKKLGISRSTVLKNLKTFNIAIRPVGSNVFRKRGIPFGYKMQLGRLVKKKNEQDIVKEMLRLRSLGFSYSKIANEFNSQSIRSKNCVGKWHGKTVYSILISKNNIDELK